MKLHQLATHVEEKCPHCGRPKGDTIHLIWKCPAFAHIRFKNAPRPEQLIVEACPAYFLLGIPGAFPALPSDWFAVPLPQSESKIEASFGLGLKAQPKKTFDCDDFVHDLGDEIAGLNYLQAAAKLLQVPCIDYCPRMSPVEGSPPPPQTLGPMGHAPGPTQAISPPCHSGCGRLVHITSLLTASWQALRSPLMCLMAKWGICALA